MAQIFIEDKVAEDELQNRRVQHRIQQLQNKLTLTVGEEIELKMLLKIRWKIK